VTMASPETHESVAGKPADHLIAITCSPAPDGHSGQRPLLLRFCFLTAPPELMARLKLILLYQEFFSMLRHFMRASLIN